MCYVIQSDFFLLCWPPHPVLSFLFCTMDGWGRLGAAPPTLYIINGGEIEITTTSACDRRPFCHEIN